MVGIVRCFFFSAAEIQAELKDPHLQNKDNQGTKSSGNIACLAANPQQSHQSILFALHRQKVLTDKTKCDATSSQLKKLSTAHDGA